MGFSFCPHFWYFILHVFSLCDLLHIFFLVDIVKNKNLRKFIQKRLYNELFDKIYHPCGKDLWILDFDKPEWYFQLSSEGNLQYNRKFVEDFFGIFGFEKKTYEKFLIFWFENVFNVRIISISRRNFDISFYFDGITTNPTKKWSVRDRFGFSYGFIRKFLDLKNESPDKTVKLKHFLDESKIYKVSDQVDC